MTTFVILGGGLGNQLFQISAGLHACDQSMLILETGILTPNEIPTTELSRFNWPNNVRIHASTNRPKLEKRLISFCIRQGAAKHPYILHKFIEVIASLAITFSRKARLQVFINRGVGFDKRLRPTKSDRILIGYFQCHQWPDNNKTILQQSLVPFSREISEESINKMCGSNFSLVHIRLGDYLTENSFGIPGNNYFHTALEYVKEHSLNESNFRFLIFSDSTKLVTKYLNTDILNQCIIFEEDHLTPSENLFLMSRAKNFIISNSTYSWWAAFLSRSNDAVVTCPDPWFSGLASPIDLVPPNWIKVQSDFRTQF